MRHAGAHVALVDPLPAGFEPLDPEINARGYDADEESAETFRTRGWWWAQWFDQQNRRDDRTELFAESLPPGVYGYTHLVSAITPGTFDAPPARAEEMYEPEVFGRSASARVVVE